MECQRIPYHDAASAAAALLTEEKKRQPLKTNIFERKRHTPHS
jgi:hypothetical protein